MKAFVLTNNAGDVIATAPVEPSTEGDAPSGGRIVPDEGHTVHEVELPEELYANAENTAEFHKAVAKHMSK